MLGGHSQYQEACLNGASEAQDPAPPLLYARGRPEVPHESQGWIPSHVYLLSPPARPRVLPTWS